METRNRKFKFEINGKVSFQDNNLEVTNFTIVNRFHRYHYSPRITVNRPHYVLLGEDGKLTLIQELELERFAMELSYIKSFIKGILI